ncbi:Hypothetical predicted protein [Mytilus galloprovincialis]|uniref:RNB domain-containing protein n=1 Tax=Mytilus galloprovincialis TaxID=29158 RepID=A0A8B6EWA7_MYTGA|nr:Hypothetical predicted protein [Mytilus galloprovincialis]
MLLMSELPEHTKMNIYTLLYRCWLICARCHYILKEYNKAVEAINLFCKDPRHYNNTDALELWAFCLLQTENYTLAKQKIEHAIKVAITRNYTQNEENYDSENASTKDSGYSYCSRIDLVEFADIDFEAEVDDVGNEWSDKQSIADSQYSALSDACSFDDTTSSVSTSSASTRSRRRKIRRKTKTVRRKKLMCSRQTLSAKHPINNLPVSKYFDKVDQWRRDHKVNYDDSRTDFMEIQYSEEDSQSEHMSDVSSIASCTTVSLAGLSADEFSGSEYDVSDSDCDWYNSASDFEEEADDLEEKLLEEPTYFQRSLSLHSGQMKARNILEKEYFQKGLNLNDEWIESVGSRYFKSKKNKYNDIRNKNFSDQCKKLPRIYKLCTISIESAHKAVCKPLEPKDEIQEISIAGRSKCGQTFTDDTVVVKIYSKQYLGKVHGEVVSLVKRHRYEDMEHPVFVCLLDITEGHLMKPLCRTVPKLHVLHSRVKDRFRKSRVEIYNYDVDKRELNFLHFHDVQEGMREQWLFIVALIKWKPNKLYPLAAVIDVIHCSQNPYDGIRILSKEYQVPYFYDKSTVEGIKAAFKEAKVFNASGYVDNTNNQRIFTIDSPGSKSIENAFSIKMQENGEFVVTIHITDVTTIVKKNDPVDMEAKARCVTFFPGKGFRPFAMLPEPLSESLCSLLPDQKRPVISVNFKFDKKGNLGDPKPTIQKTIIKSSKQFTYQEVQNILEDRLEDQHNELSQDVKMLFKFSKHLKEVRLGHASFSFPVEIDVSEDENPMDTYEAHSLVEEFVILTNLGIAQLLRRQYPGSVPLYCQEPPSFEVFDNWYNMNQHYIHHILGLQTIGTPRGKISVFHSPPEGRTRRITPVQTWVLEEIKDLLPDTAQNMSRIKQLIQSDFLHPKQALAFHEWNLFQESSKYVCSTEVLKNQDKGRNFFLGKKSYVHFTSPLRRYNDLVVHRLVSAMIKKETYPPYEPQEISDICLIMNDATKRANQFNNDCKQIIFGRFFKKYPVLFNGFVKETTDNGIKIVIPGLQNLPTFKKEIQFKLLDVACKPEKGDDVEMLSMSEHEKERKMVVVKWEKRLYSYKHRTCRKPKTSRISYERKLFSPYLRIFPHQNTTFLRYKEHWFRILTCILEEKNDSLRNLLSNFKDNEQTILNILHDKDTVGSFKRSVIDVSSEVKQGIIVEHRCRFQVPYHHGQIIQLQMSASLNRGFLTPTPQVLDVTENVKFCIDHFDNPIKTLLRFAKLHTKSDYASIDDYIRTWIPIVEMESTLNAVQNEDTAVINDIPVEFRGRRGRFFLTKGFCDVRDMDVSSEDIEKLSAGIIHETEQSKNEASRYHDHKHNTDEELPMSSADEIDTEDKISNTDDIENLFLDKEIETTSRSENDFIESNIEKRESEEKSKDGSSQKKKPKYSKMLSPHFLCIKLKRPLTENVKSKIGKVIPKQSQYIWVAHAELLKSRKIRGRTYSERRGCYKKVLEIDLVFKLHKNSPLPPIDKVTSDDKCSIELIMKSKVLRRIECYIKLLGQASELAQNIALGHRISGLDQDHLRLCRTMSYEVDVLGFPANNIQQETAIKKALMSRFSLIQGPPGTGKTFTGVKLVYLFNRLNKLYDEKDGKRRRVIFCGPSNKSVDLVARWVVKKLGEKAPKIVRMYASAYEYLDFPVPGRAIISDRSMRDAKSDSALNKNGVVLHHIIRSDGKPYADRIQKFDAKFREDNIIINENQKLPHEQRKPVKTRLQDIYEYKSLLHSATVEELDNYDVIFCTTSLAGNPRLLSATKGQVAQVIIDECGMCSEPECMVPIIATHATQIVLIGDHKQLRPIIKSREASELGLEKSLFERYSTDDSLMTMLEQQYRMNKSICEFPSRMFYDGKLKTANDKIGRPLKPLKMWQKSNGIPRVFCHVEGEEEILTVKTKEGNEQSRSNMREIEQVLKVFRHMVTVEGVDPGTINVMSQYNAQCTALRAELKEKGFDKFDVTTVVSSQGGEWDYVIFSLVRSLPKYLIEKNPTKVVYTDLGFITDRHRLM